MNGKNKQLIVKSSPRRERAPRAVLGEQPHMLIGGVNSHTLHIPIADGVEGSCGIDWLAGSLPVEKIDAVMEFLENLYGIAPDVTEKNIQLYDRLASFDPFGCRVFFDSTEKRCKSLHRGRFAVQFSGGGLQQFTANGLWKLLGHLVNDFWFKGTRIDINYDDFTKRILPHQIAEMANEGGYTGYRVHQHLCSRSRSGKVLGDTLYFGKRGKNGSGKFLRIYDKFLESDGEVDCVRYEVEFSKERARLICLHLGMCSTVEDMAGNICGLVGGSIDFIVRNGKNLDRSDRVQWWADILSVLGEVVLRNPVRVETVEKTIRYVERLKASISLARLSMGDPDFYAFMGDLSSMPKEELPKSHRRRLEVFQWETEVPF